MACGIYKITNIVNNKVYVGQSKDVNSRLRDHQSRLKNIRHPNTHLQNSYNKYGKDSFIFEVLEQFNPEMNFNIDNLERYWIEFYDSTNPLKGYNLQTGGHSNKSHSIETILKLSEAKKGDKNPSKRAEVRLKISLSRIGKVSPNKGKKETRPEVIQKMSYSHKNIPMSANCKIALFKTNSKKVIDSDTGLVWDNANIAAYSLGVKPQTLRNWLRGDRKNKTNLRYV